MRELDHLRRGIHPGRRTSWDGAGDFCGEFAVTAADVEDPFAAAHVRLTLPLGDLGIAYDESFRAENVLTGERFIWRGPFAAWYFEPARNPAAIFRIERMPRAELTELG